MAVLLDVALRTRGNRIMIPLCSGTQGGAQATALGKDVEEGGDLTQPCHPRASLRALNEIN